MWSFGCIMAELFTGYPLFPGENEAEQLALIMEVRGIPDDQVLSQATRGDIFFEDGEPILQPNSRGRLRQPNTKTMAHILKCNDETFIRFIEV